MRTTRRRISDPGDATFELNAYAWFLAKIDAAALLLGTGGSRTAGIADETASTPHKHDG